MEVIAFFLIFVAVQHFVSGGSKKTQQPTSSPDTAKRSLLMMGHVLACNSIAKMQALGAKESSEAVPEVPHELLENRNWDEYQSPAYRRR